MGPGLRQLARQARCPRCGYDVAGLDPWATCPECGIDHAGRIKRLERRDRRSLDWMQAYFFLAIIGGSTYVPMLTNIIAGIFWNGAMPWDPGFRTFVENDDLPILDMRFGFAFMGMLISALLWPFMLAMLAWIMWNRWRDRRDKRTPWWLWLLLVAPAISPVVLWYLGMNFLIMPD